jgi:2-polyprenyl-6-methoxyphenol hydroxylase-like FAD-dependent oxidoreductase
VPPPISVDTVVIGAGPAGCCAVLRLLALGHRVALLERCEFPRPHVGEAISPGIWNILEYIDATDCCRARTQSQFRAN